MSSARDVDVAEILSLVYRRPPELDQLTTRVKARLALSATLGECARLVFEAPWSALRHSVTRPGARPEATARAAGLERKAE